MSANATDPSLSPRNRMAIVNRNVSSPRTGAASAPVSHDSRFYLSPGSHLPSPRHQSIQLPSPSQQRSFLTGQPAAARDRMPSLPLRDPRFRRGRAGSMENGDSTHTGAASSLENRTGDTLSPRSPSGRRVMSVASASIAKAKARTAQKENDSMVYLDGPVVYTCAQCRTHLTSHDDIISKSFHGRHGRAYLFDQCVNVTIGKAEDRLLITGLHSVCDIYCKRCKNMVGWTYAKAYEASQKYKEGKFIIEKINLHLEESPSYDVEAPAGERSDRWRRRSMSWGNEFAQSPPMSPRGNGGGGDLVYEYRPSILPPNGFNRCQSM